MPTPQSKRDDLIPNQATTDEAEVSDEVKLLRRYLQLRGEERAHEFINVDEVAEISVAIATPLFIGFGKRRCWR